MPDSSLPVLVIGGGPIGLAAAIALRLRGANVILVDHALPPVDKACGEGLMPGTTEVLRRFGIRLPVGVGVPFRGIRFVKEGFSVAADFPEVGGLGLRRLALHELLRQRAEQLGIPLQWGQKDLQGSDRTISIAGVPQSFSLIVGADGLNSSVRRWFGLDHAVRESRRYGFRQHFAGKPWSEYVEIYWHARFQLYVTPVSASEIGIAVLTGDPSLRLQTALAELPEVAERLRGLRPSSAERGSLTISRQFRHLHCDKAVLVGDASGSVDAITGEGLCLGFQQAELLADCWAKRDFQHYERDHGRLCRRPRRMGRLMLMLARQPFLQERVIRALSRQPSLFRGLLALHIGAETGISDFPVPGLLRFAYDCLTTKTYCILR